MELVAVITLCAWSVLGTWGWSRQTGITKTVIACSLEHFSSLVCEWVPHKYTPGSACCGQPLLLAGLGQMCFDFVPILVVFVCC